MYNNHLNSFVAKYLKRELIVYVRTAWGCNAEWVFPGFMVDCNERGVERISREKGSVMKGRLSN